MDGGVDQAPLSLNIAYPQDNGNCGPGNLIYTWQCSNIDQGGQYANEAGYVSMVIKPGGTAAIAYSELNTYEDKNSLKVAFQEWRIYLPLTKK
jgi:hypothetical protein